MLSSRQKSILSHDWKDIFLSQSFRFYLGNRQDGHGEDERDGPGDHVEVGGSTRQRLVGGAQGFERCVPGIGQHDEPNHARHQGVVHDDKDGDTGQRLRRPEENM